MEHPLRTARTRKGFTPQELAMKARLHWTYIYKIESGQRQPSVRVLQRLGKALGVHWTQLVEN